MTVVKEFLQDRLVDPDTLKLPYGVRTPGRTWTTFEVENADTGDGSVTVDAPEVVEVSSLAQAASQYPDKVENVFFNELDPQSNQVAQLHVQHLKEAVFIHIPAGTVVEEPITVTTTAESGFFPHHVLVYAEDGSVVQIVEQNTGTADCDSSFAEIHVGEQATVQYTKLNAIEAGKGYSDNAAHVEENGAINWLMLSTGADLYRNTIVTRLAGSRSSLQYNLGFLAADNQHMDHTTHVIHDGDHTRCNMDSRGVVMDTARTVYMGVQQVEETTTGTKSFQDEKTILIGNECEADTTPQLQINNNEVEATHAATTGHIDDESLFYMRSRGLSETAATREIITGMFEDLIENDASATELVHEKIQRTLGQRQR